MAEIDWARWLRPGDRMVASHMSAEPAALISSLASYRDLPQPLHIFLGVPFTEAAAALPASCNIGTFGGMGSGAAIAKQRRIDITPLAYGSSERAYEEGLWHCDVALVSLGQSAQGRLYLGPSHGPILAAARRARHVVAQVSPRVLCLPGAEWPLDLPIAARLAVDEGPCTIEEALTGPAENAIAQHVAQLVPDGACLQVGIGALPSAMLHALQGHRHLGVHTGMLTDALFRLVTSGVADGSRKSIDADLAVTGSVCGTAALYETLRHAAGSIVLRPPSYTHDAGVIARLDGMVCLNSCIEIDLLGNVNAEAVLEPQGRWRFVGGVGGLPDFVRAARAARLGRSVIALPSRSLRGKPRIVARLDGPCTVPACDADVVVTEHGVAHLRAAPLAERVRRMVAIAHEQDRDALLVAATKLGLI